MILNEGYDSTERADKAKGKYIYVNNKWVLDTSMCVGTHIFGHGALTPFMKKVLNKGTLFTLPNKITDECAELLQQATKFNHFVFCNTGSEATLRCIRIARAYTGRDKIILFEGCWHGTHDWNLALYSEGIPQAVKDMVIVLPFSEKALERLDQKDIALVMIEPIQSSLPLNRKDYLNLLRKKCTDTGTILCFDEVISGFRMAIGGAAQYFNIKPDLVAYGKTIGGGFPIGIVGGDDVMNIIKKGVRMGGTFSANPLTMNACKYVLKKLLVYSPYKKIHDTMALLSEIKTDVLQIIVLGGMARVLFTNKKINSIKDRNENELSLNIQKQIIRQLLNKGMYLAGNNTIMFSDLHTNKDVDCIKNYLNNIKGF